MRKEVVVGGTPLLLVLQYPSEQGINSSPAGRLIGGWYYLAGQSLDVVVSFLQHSYHTSSQYRLTSAAHTPTESAQRRWH